MERIPSLCGYLYLIKLSWNVFQPFLELPQLLNSQGTLSGPFQRYHYLIFRLLANSSIQDLSLNATPYKHQYD